MKGVYEYFLDKNYDMGFYSNFIRYIKSKKLKPTFEPIADALLKVINITKDCPYRRTFHSDQGWAYQMNRYTELLKVNKIFQSMSRKGTCLDNSPMENFFGVMKQEMYHGKIYRSFEELKIAINEYVNYYNNDRIKEKLNWNNPVTYRIKHNSTLCN